MRAECGAEVLCDVQGLQGGGGFRVGKWKDSQLCDTDCKCKDEDRCVQPAFVFEVSVGHGRNCNPFSITLFCCEMRRVIFLRVLFRADSFLYAQILREMR